MIREILRGVLATVVSGFDRGQSVAVGVLMVALLFAGCTAYFATLFAVLGVYVLLGAPSALTGLAGVLGFGGGFVVACIVVIALVKVVFRYRPTEAPRSAAKPPHRSRTEVLADVGALDRRFTAPDEALARDAAADDSAT